MLTKHCLRQLPLTPRVDTSQRLLTPLFYAGQLLLTPISKRAWEHNLQCPEGVPPVGVTSTCIG